MRRSTSSSSSSSSSQPLARVTPWFAVLPPSGLLPAPPPRRCRRFFSQCAGSFTPFEVAGTTSAMRVTLVPPRFLRFKLLRRPYRRSLPHTTPRYGTSARGAGLPALATAPAAPLSAERPSTKAQRGRGEPWRHRSRGFPGTRLFLTRRDVGRAFRAWFYTSRVRFL